MQGAATGFASRSAGLCLIRESRPGFSFLPSFLPWPRAEDGSVDIQVSYKGLDLAFVLFYFVGFLKFMEA